MLFSFAIALFRIVRRFTVKRPARVFPQTCVKPRKSNVFGLPSPRFCRSASAHQPNSSSRVLSGCSVSPNF